MEKIAKAIVVGRRIDLPGLQEPPSPGEYTLIWRVEADPIDDRRVYHNGGELIGTGGDRRLLLWGHQVEALLQSPHVTIAEIPLPAAQA